MAETLARIVDGPIDRAELEGFAATSADGAVVVFEGVIRDHDHGERVSGLEYSAHPDALAFLEEICGRVAQESGLRVAAAHRIGSLEIGDVALVAVVAAAHRREAFETCSRLVDEIKAGVPIWKRQLLADGATEWVGL
jgi:molybdopterin synthase catalytic subunit